MPDIFISYPSNNKYAKVYTELLSEVLDSFGLTVFDSEFESLTKGNKSDLRDFSASNVIVVFWTGVSQSAEWLASYVRMLSRFKKCVVAWDRRASPPPADLEHAQIIEFDVMASDTIDYVAEAVMSAFENEDFDENDLLSSLGKDIPANQNYNPSNRTLSLPEISPGIQWSFCEHSRTNVHLNTNLEAEAILLPFQMNTTDVLRKCRDKLLDTFTEWFVRVPGNTLHTPLFTLNSRTRDTNNQNRIAIYRTDIPTAFLYVCMSIFFIGSTYVFVSQNLKNTSPPAGNFVEVNISKIETASDVSALDHSQVIISKSGESTSNVSDNNGELNPDINGSNSTTRETTTKISPNTVSSSPTPKGGAIENDELNKATPFKNVNASDLNPTEDILSPREGLVLADNSSITFGNQTKGLSVRGSYRYSNHGELRYLPELDLTSASIPQLSSHSETDVTKPYSIDLEASIDGTKPRGTEYWYITSQFTDNSQAQTNVNATYVQPTRNLGASYIASPTTVGVQANYGYPQLKIQSVPGHPYRKAELISLDSNSLHPVAELLANQWMSSDKTEFKATIRTLDSQGIKERMEIFEGFALARAFVEESMMELYPNNIALTTHHMDNSMLKRNTNKEACIYSAPDLRSGPVAIITNECPKQAAFKSISLIKSF